MTTADTRFDVGSRPDGSLETIAFALALAPDRLAEQLFGPGCIELTRSGSLVGRIVSAWDDETISSVANVEALITGWGAPPITDAVLDRLPNLRYVLHAGGQAASLLPPSAAERGIRATNAGAANAIPVAEYTVAMVTLSGKESWRAQAMYRDRQAQIDRETEFADSGNVDRVLGIVGASRIGVLVMERLRSFDIELLLFDPFVDEQGAAKLGATKVATLTELFARSDVISVHAPLNRDTQHMIGAVELAALRDGSTLINTARGGLIDQSALLTELASGRISAVIDVTTPEVLPAGHPFYTLPNVVLTPHIAGSMGRELRRMGRAIGDELARAAAGDAFAHPEPLR